MSTDTINENETVDARTDSQKRMDGIAGNKGLTKLDKQYANVHSAAVKLYLDNKATKKYLLLGEETDVYMKMFVSGGGKREDGVKRLTELLHESGLGMEDIRVNDWIAVYNLAKLVTSTDSVAEISNVWLGTVAYRTLAMLKVAIDRDGMHYTFKTGWGDEACRLIRDGVRGKALVEAIKEHTEFVKESQRSAKMRKLSPSKQAQLEAAELADAREKQISAINKSAKVLREKAIEANFSPDDIFATLVHRGVIEPPDMDIASYVHTMDADKANELANALIERGNVSIVMTVASILSGWLKTNAESDKAVA